MATQHSKQPHGFMPGFDGRTDRERELDAANRRIEKEQTILKLRVYIRKEQARLLRNRERLHFEANQLNAAWSKKL